jgi:hypothetical protein
LTIAFDEPTLHRLASRGETRQASEAGLDVNAIAYLLLANLERSTDELCLRTAEVRRCGELGRDQLTAIEGARALCPIGRAD